MGLQNDYPLLICVALTNSCHDIMLLNLIYTLPLLVIDGLYLLVIAGFIGLFVYQIFLWHSFKYWKQKNVEQVPSSYPFGNFKDVLFQKTSIGLFLQKLYQDSKTDIIGFYILHTPHLLIRSPDVIKQVLVSDFNHFYDHTIASDERADSLSSKMLLNVKNPEWKIMRQKVTPIFTTSKIRGMSEHVFKSTNDLLKYLDGKQPEGRPIECKELLAKFTTDVITSCAFGVDANSFIDENAPFRNAGRALLDTSFINGLRFMAYFLMPSAVKLFRIPFLDQKTLGFLRDAFLETIGLRESKLGVRRGDLIDIIIELKKTKELPGGIMFEGDRIVAQGIQFFAAGYETTSATLSFLLYELALHPNIQDKVRQSVLDLLKSAGKINYDSMLQLSYMERAIMETLRKYPPLPFLDRRCNKEFKLPHSDVVIDKNTPVFISLLGIHYDEQYFPDPTRFDPDRFLPEEQEKRHPFAYLPFGHGPRTCIGERFAMNTMKICLAQLLLKYKVEPCSKTPIPIEFAPKAFTLIPRNGLFLRLVKL